MLRGPATVVPLNGVSAGVESLRERRAETWLLVTHCYICPHCYRAPDFVRVRCGIRGRPHAVAGALGIPCNWVASRFSFTVVFKLNK